jgi:hypothetical protein
VDLSALIAGFAELHERAKKQALEGGEQQAYRDAKIALTNALLLTQRRTLDPAAPQRQYLQAARAIQVELDLSTGLVHTLTLDISRGGFASLLEKPPPKSEPVAFTLKLPGGGEPLRGHCKLVGTAPQRGVLRAGFVFQNLSEQDGERIELLVFDSVLDQLRASAPKR